MATWEPEFGLSGVRSQQSGESGLVGRVEAERWFFRLVGVLDQAGHQSDEKVCRAAMAGVLDLRNVLQLIVHRLNQRSLAEHDLIHQRHQAIGHVTPNVGDQLQPAIPKLGE